MKKALLFFILGCMVTFYWFTNHDIEQLKSVKATPEDRIALVSDIFTEWSTDVKSWFAYSNENEPDQVTIEQRDVVPSDYEAALSIVSELIHDLKGLLTTEQKIAIEEHLNQLYKKNILKQYAPSPDVPMYRE